MLQTLLRESAQSHVSFLFFFSLHRSDPLSVQTLAKNDVVKLHIGAQIDGFAAISAETMVVGATAKDPVTGRRADVLKAAWHAAEVAMRLVKIGNKNWLVTDAVGKVAANWGCKPVEGKNHDFYIPSNRFSGF
jgi:methionine aminopeptidase